MTDVGILSESEISTISSNHRELWIYKSLSIEMTYSSYSYNTVSCFFFYKKLNKCTYLACTALAYHYCRQIIIINNDNNIN